MSRRYAPRGRAKSFRGGDAATCRFGAPKHELEQRGERLADALLQIVATALSGV